jgi:hypothetical protein
MFLITKTKGWLATNCGGGNGMQYFINITAEK